jgi:hypothetical protein
MASKTTISFTYEQLSALDDAIEFVLMGRDDDLTEPQPWVEVIAKVRTAYDRATRAEEATDGVL